MKYLVVILSGILTLIIVFGDFFSNKLSDLNFEKTNYLISVNQTLLDSYNKGFYAIGLGIDAVGFLIERRKEQYNQLMDNADMSKASFDSLYQKAMIDLIKMREKEKEISQIASWHSLTNTSSLVFAVLILVFSLFAERNRMTKKSAI